MGALLITLALFSQPSMTSCQVEQVHRVGVYLEYLRREPVAALRELPDALAEIAGACPAKPVTLADCMAGSDDEACSDWEDNSRQLDVAEGRQR
jgi:hypothetical protein